MGPSCGLILASFWDHFCFILGVLGVLKNVLLYCCRTNDLTAIYSTFVGSAENLCTHRTGSALSLMPLSSGYPFLRHVGTASPLGRPKTVPKTAPETSWRPLEPPRDPPGDAKATQETPRTHQKTPKRPQWTDRRPFGRPQGAPRATQKPPKRPPKHPRRPSQTGEP